MKSNEYGTLSDCSNTDVFDSGIIVGRLIYNKSISFIKTENNSYKITSKSNILKTTYYLIEENEGYIAKVVTPNFTGLFIPKGIIKINNETLRIKNVKSANPFNKSNQVQYQIKNHSKLIDYRFPLACRNSNVDYKGEICSENSTLIINLFGLFLVELTIDRTFDIS